MELNKFWFKHNCNFDVCCFLIFAVFIKSKRFDHHALVFFKRLFPKMLKRILFSNNITWEYVVLCPVLKVSSLVTGEPPPPLNSEISKEGHEMGTFYNIDHKSVTVSWQILSFPCHVHLPKKFQNLKVSFFLHSLGA